MVVAANPGSSITVAPELDLVKAAVLYGDKVTLISPVTTMLLRIEGLERFSPRQQIELMRRVAPILIPPNELTDFQLGIEQVADFLRSSARGGSGGDRILRAGLLEQFRPMTRILSEMVRELGAKAGIDQLAKAREKGIVRIESADPGDSMDLLVSCILSAKLDEIGERQDEPHTDRIVKTFVDMLSRHLASGREYLVFDAPIASLTEAAIREGVFKPAKGPAGRCAQAMFAASLMGRLPTFPDATLDEVLDIRSALAAPLTQFRSAMVTVAKGFTSTAWEAGFDDEVHDAWVETIHPAIEAIESGVRDDRSMLARSNGLIGFLKPNLPSLTVLGAGIVGHEPIATALGAACTVVPALLQALRDREARAGDIRMKPFYFLYGVEQSLAEMR